MAAGPIIPYDPTRGVQGKTETFDLTPQSAPSSFAAGDPSPEAAESRFATAASRPTQSGEFTTSDIRNYMEENGVNVESPGVVAFLMNVPSDLSMEMLTLVTQSFASDPATSTRVATDWDAAMQESGFRDQDVFQPSSPMSYKIAAMEGIAPRSLAPEYVTQTESGWIQYKSGVLVNPADGSVLYKPGATAAGSPSWMANSRENWSTERVEQERQKLIEFGYLDPDAKKGAWDLDFEEALSNFHYQRYLHGGDAIPVSAGAGGAGAASKMGLNARDFQAQIRNDVREQFARVYGDEPSEEELRTWSDFVTKTSLRLQRKYIRKDISPGEARAAAATEAEERFIEKIEQSPEAVYLRENYQENTRLRDSIEQGVVVANSLMG